MLDLEIGLFDDLCIDESEFSTYHGKFLSPTRLN